jgi:heavy metal translocating P-type ATPase
LPVLSITPANGGPVYCCYGCYLVSRVIGHQNGDGQQTWSLLRMAIGALLAMNVMMISLLLYTKTVEADSVPFFRWLLLGLATPAMLILEYPFVLGCLEEFRRRRLSLDTLIAMGSLTAFLVSAVNTLRGAGHIYYDTATMLLVLVTFGKLIEATAKHRAGKLLRVLETMLPQSATLMRDGRPCPVTLDSLRLGDIVQVRPGERIPVDGDVVEGATTVEEAAFTGEPAPRLCQTGDRVIAGSVNGMGTILVTAQRVGEQLLLYRMIQMVEDARQQPSSTQRLAERIAAVFVPVVLALSVGTGCCWFLMGNASQAGMAALAVLVVACPCAMGIATPLATSIAISRAAREGIVVRGGDVMERIGQVRTLFFDKTGTLTVGRLSVSCIESLDPTLSESELLAWLAGLESGSEHAIARAILNAAAQRQVAFGTVRDVQIIPGRGARGHVTVGPKTRLVMAGTEEHLAAMAVPCPAEESPEERLTDMTQVVVAWDGQVRGRVFLADSPRPGAREAVGQLQAAGLGVCLLSGDRFGPVQVLARHLGIAQYHASCLPDRKIERVRAAKGVGSSASNVVGMVGDGINDAPALAAADVGIAFGAGTELARQSGNVVLLSNRLKDIPWLVALSRYARRVVRQNLFWALGYNMVAITAAVLGVLHPLLAALAMVVSSLTVISNSARLNFFPKSEARAQSETGRISKAVPVEE